MSQRIVMVYNETTGLPERLQPGDYALSSEYPSAINGNAGSIVIGSPVYSSAAGSVDLAKADAVGTADVIGLIVNTTVATGATCNYSVDGSLVLTTAQWDTICGTTGGLTFKTLYFLSATTAGKLTSVPLSTQGQFNVLVGEGLSATEMKIFIQPRIKL